MKRFCLVILLGAVGILAGTGCTPELDPPVLEPGRADFTRVVALGGSVMSGYQDGALYEEGQRNSLGNLLASRLNFGQDIAFNAPLIPTGASLGVNPKPWESPYQSRSAMGERVDCEDVVSLGPVKTELSLNDITASGAIAQVSGTQHNFAIPSATLADLTNPTLSSASPNYGPALFYQRFADPSSSPLGAAIAQDPTFVIFNPGLQDIVNWAATGGALSPLPDAAAFRAQLDSMLGALTANGAKGVLGTIPDIGDLPFFTTVSSQSLELDQVLADSLNAIYALGSIDIGFQAGANGFIIEDNAVSPPFRQLSPDEYLTLTVPLDSMRCFLLGVLIQVIPDRYSLIDSELAALRTTVQQMNAAIIDLAANYDFAVADVAGLYADLSQGIVQDGVDFSTEFVSGNYFSLDGLGPTPKGAGMLTNVYVAAINAHFGATVPTVRLDDLRAVLLP
ncbi:MAG: hypothetical protein AAGN35_03340 [Bacteroidota bacterium]